MRLVHSATPAEDVFALFDADDRPVLFRIIRPTDFPVGAVCLARVLKKQDENFFLNIAGKSAFMRRPKTYRSYDGTMRDTPLNEGDFLFVKVSRAAFEEKDAKVSPVIEALDDGLIRAAADKKTRILIWPESEVVQTAKEYADVLDDVVTDNPLTAKRLKAVFSGARFCPAGTFDAEGLADAREEALATKVALRCGGCLSVEQTAACVCFDVDAGAAKMAVANTESCPEIARQIRLKGLTGQMIVDFAGGKDGKEISALSKQLKKSGVPVFGVSSLGLVEISSRRGLPSVFEFCKSEDRVVAYDITRRLWFGRPAGGKIIVRAPQNVLNFISPVVKDIEIRTGESVSLVQGTETNIQGIE